MIAQLILFAVAALAVETAGRASATTEISPTRALREPASHQVSSGNADSTWRPSQAQVEQVERSTYAYFAARDERRYADAYAHFATSQKQAVPFESFRSRVQEFNTRAGQVLTRNIRKVTWYKNHPQGLGVFAAADFSSQFTDLSLHCGYVVWQEQPDGSFQLVREEENIVEKAMEAKLKPGDLERVRAQFRC